MSLAWSDSILSWIWKASWQGSILAILILAVQWLFRKRLSAGWRSALWLLLLVRLIFPISFPSGASVFNLAPRKVISTFAPSPSTPALVPAVPVTPLYQKFTTEWTDADQNAPHSSLSTARISSQRIPPQSTLRVRLMATLPWFWAMGALIQMARSCWQSARFRSRLILKSLSEPRELIQVLDECRRKMGVRRRPELVETEAVQSPAVYGLLPPRILLPFGMARTYSAREMRFIFLHELAHLKRHDLAVNWVIAAVQVLHWFNPVLLFAFSRMRADRELAADALALECVEEGENRSYGDTIIRILAGLNTFSKAPGLMGILEDKRQIVRRIRMIADFKRSKWSAWAFACFAGLAAVTLTDAQTPSSAKAPASEKTLESTALRPVPAEGPVAELILAGKESIARGKLADAEAVLLKALQQSPGNQEAKYLFDLIREVRLARTSRKKEVIVPSGERTPSASEAGAVRNLNQKLDQIILPKVEYENALLADVVRDLKRQTKELDPEKAGVDFAFEPNLELTEPASAQLEEVENTVVQLRMNQASLRQVLRGVVRGAGLPVKYVYNGRAIVFTKALATSPALFTRVYRVDPNTLRESLLQTKSTAPLEGGTNTIELLREFFAALGMDFGVKIQPSGGFPSPRSAIAEISSSQNAVFYNDRTGLILVRGTMNDLDTIEKAIQVLNANPPQVSIETTFVTVTEDEQRSLGFDWFLGNQLASSKTTNGRPPSQAGASPSFDAVPGGVTQAPESGPANLGDIPSKESEPASNAPVTITGILTDPQFRAVVRGLEQRSHSEKVLGPRVTTLSGRRAQIDLTSEDGGSSTLDALPIVKADGTSIQMELSFVLRRAKAAASQSNNGPDSHLPLRVVTEAIVFDGQALVLGPFPVDAHRGKKPAGAKQALYVFITPTIVDPAGNRVHSE